MYYVLLCFDLTLIELILCDIVWWLIWLTSQSCLMVNLWMNDEWNEWIGVHYLWPQLQKPIVQQVAATASGEMAAILARVQGRQQTIIATDWTSAIDCLLTEIKVSVFQLVMPCVLRIWFPAVIKGHSNGSCALCTYANIVDIVVFLYFFTHGS